MSGNISTDFIHFATKINGRNGFTVKTAKEWFKQANYKFACEAG